MPAPIALWMTDIRELEPADFIAGFVGARQRVLNIGPSWGRDYYTLQARGKQVVNLDIAVQTHLERLALGDVTRGLPFADQSFDAVILAEVLEHLIEDGGALREARRVLRDDGVLIVTVPFNSDGPEYHVRLHSRHTIRRLLHSAGFEISEYYARGGLVSVPRAVHLVRRLARLIMPVEKYNQAVIRLDRFLGRQAGGLLRLSPYYGCYLQARKAARLDFSALNAREFKH